MNLPDPSGSSPALKPPGNMMIWAWAMRLAISSIDSAKSCAVLLRRTMTSATAPARSKASAESYSQFVPGHTGIGIHGTHAPESIGTRATEGCIRLNNDDLERLVDLIYPPLSVVITPSARDEGMNTKSK